MADHPAVTKELSDFCADKINPDVLSDQRFYHGSFNVGKSDELEKCSNSPLNVAEECIQSFLHQGILNTMNENVPEQTSLLSVPFGNRRLVSPGNEHQDKTCIAEDTINSLLEVNAIVPESSVCDDRLSITAEDEAGCLSDTRVIMFKNNESEMEIPGDSVSGIENMQLNDKAHSPGTADDRLSITCEDTGDNSEVKATEKKTLGYSKLQKSEGKQNSGQSEVKGADGNCKEKKESEGATARKEKKHKHHKKHSKKKKKKYRQAEKKKKKKKKKKEKEKKDKSGEPSRSHEESLKSRSSDGPNKQSAPKHQLSSVIAQPSKPSSFFNRKSSSIYFAGKKNFSEDIKFKDIATVKDPSIPGLSAETPDEFDDDWLSYSSEIKAAQMKTTKDKIKYGHSPEEKKKSDGDSRRKHSKERENDKRSYSSRKQLDRKSEKEKEIEPNRRKSNSDDLKAKKVQRRISEEKGGSSPEGGEIDPRKRRSTVDVKKKRRKISNSRDSEFQGRNDAEEKEIMDAKLKLDISSERSITTESRKSRENSDCQESSGKVKVSTARKLADSPERTEKDSTRKKFNRKDHEGQEFIFDTKSTLNTSVEMKEGDQRRSNSEVDSLKEKKHEKDVKDRSKSSSIGIGENENKGKRHTAVDSLKEKDLKMEQSASIERRDYNQPDRVHFQENIDKEKNMGEEIKSTGIVQSGSHKEKIVLSLKPKRKPIRKSASNSDWCKAFEESGEQQNSSFNMFADKEKIISVRESFEQGNIEKEETRNKQYSSLDMFAENEKRTSSDKSETHEESSKRRKETPNKTLSVDMFAEDKKATNKSPSVPSKEISGTPMPLSTSMAVLKEKNENERDKKENRETEKDTIESVGRSTGKKENRKSEKEYIQVFIEKSKEKRDNRKNEKEDTMEFIGKSKEKKESRQNEKEDTREILMKSKEKKESRKNEKEDTRELVGSSKQKKENRKNEKEGTREIIMKSKERKENRRNEKEYGREITLKRKEKSEELNSDKDIYRKKSSISKTPQKTQSFSPKRSRSKSTSKHKSRSPSHTSGRSLSKTRKKRTSYSKAQSSSSEETSSDSSSNDSSDEKSRRKSRSRTPKRSDRNKYKQSRSRRHRSRSKTPKVTPRRYRSRSGSPKKSRKYKERSRSRSPAKQKKHVPRTFRAVSYSSSSSSTSWSTISSSPSPKVKKSSRGKSRNVRKSKNFSRSRSRSLTPHAERISRRKSGGKRSPLKKPKRFSAFLRSRSRSKSPSKGRASERKSFSPVRKDRHISRLSRSRSRSKSPKAKSARRKSIDKSPKRKFEKLSIEKDDKIVKSTSPNMEHYVEKMSRSVSSERLLSPDIENIPFDNLQHSEKSLVLPSTSPQKTSIGTSSLKLMSSAEMGQEDHNESLVNIKSTLRERSNSESTSPIKAGTELIDTKLGYKLDNKTRSKCEASIVLIIPEEKISTAFQENTSTDIRQQPQQTMNTDVIAALAVSSNERDDPKKNTILAPVFPDEKPPTIQQTQQLDVEKPQISQLPKDVKGDFSNSNTSLVTVTEKSVTMETVVDKHDSMTRQKNISLPRRAAQLLNVSEESASLETKKKLVSDNMRVADSIIGKKPNSNSAVKETHTFVTKDTPINVTGISSEDSKIPKDLQSEQNVPQEIPRQSYEQAFDRLPPPPPPPMPIPFRNVFNPLGRFSMPGGPPGPGFAPRLPLAPPLRNALPFQPNLETMPQRHVEATSFTPTNQIVNIPGLGLGPINESESLNFGMQQQHRTLLGLPTSASVIPFLGDSDTKPTNGSSDEPATADIIESADAGSPIDMEMSGSSPEVDIIEKMNEEFWKNEQNTLDEAYEPDMLPVFLDEPVEVSVSSGTRKKRLTKRVKKKRRKDLSGEKKEEPRTKVQVLLDKLHRQARVEEEVKIVLKEYYKHREIDKSEYKSILRKAVPQVANSSHSIDPERIRSLVKKYVAKAKGSRGLPQP